MKVIYKKILSLILTVGIITSLSMPVGAINLEDHSNSEYNEEVGVVTSSITRGRPENGVYFKWSNPNANLYMNAYTYNYLYSGCKVNTYAFTGDNTQRFYTQSGTLRCSANPNYKIARTLINDGGFIYTGTTLQPISYSFEAIRPIVDDNEVLFKTDSGAFLVHMYSTRTLEFVYEAAYMEWIMYA